MKFDLETAIENVIRDHARSKEFADHIKKTVCSALDGVVSNLFQSYGPCMKSLNEQIASAMNFDVKELGLHGYNQTLLAIMKQQLDRSMNLVGAEKLKTEMQKLLGDTAPAQVNLSDLVFQFKQWVANGVTSHDGINIRIGENEHGGRWISLERKSKYVTPDKFHFRVDSRDGSVLFISIGGISPKEAVFAGSLYGFPGTLFRIYAAGTKVIIDETEFDNVLPSGSEDREDDDGDDDD